MGIKQAVLFTAPQVLKLKAKLIDRKQKHRARFARLRDEFYARLWEDTAHELGATIKSIGYGYYQLSLNGKSSIVHGPDVMLDNHLALRLAGNKPLIHKLLSEHDFPVVRYREFDLEHLETACDFLNTLPVPGVVKPADAGSAGKGITTGVCTQGQLRRAALWASCFSETLVIENQVPGESYRLLFLNGRYLDAIKRTPPKVHGDGSRSIRKLIEDENERRISNGAIISLHPITVDSELRNHLRATGHHLKKVLPANETVTVKAVVNQNSRHENESVREIVHPDNIKMGERIAELLKIELAGIDIICRDITLPLDTNNGVINEVNTTPALHHHYLLNDESKIMPVALHIQKYILNGKAS